MSFQGHRPYRYCHLVILWRGCPYHVLSLSLRTITRPIRGAGRKPGASAYTRKRLSLSHSTDVESTNQVRASVCAFTLKVSHGPGHVRSRFECLFSMALLQRVLARGKFMMSRRDSWVIRPCLFSTALLTGRCGVRSPCASKGSSSGCSKPPPSVRRGWPPRQKRCEEARRAVSIQGSLYPENTELNQIQITLRGSGGSSSGRGGAGRWRRRTLMWWTRLPLRWRADAEVGVMVIKLYAAFKALRGVD